MGKEVCRNPFVNQVSFFGADYEDRTKEEGKMSQSLRKSGQFLWAMDEKQFGKQIRESQSLRKSGQFLYSIYSSKAHEPDIESQSLRKSGQFLSRAAKR